MIVSRLGANDACQIVCRTLRVRVCAKKATEEKRYVQQGRGSRHQQACLVRTVLFWLGREPKGPSTIITSLVLRKCVNLDQAQMTKSDSPGAKAPEPRNDKQMGAPMEGWIFEAVADIISGTRFARMHKTNGIASLQSRTRKPPARDKIPTDLSTISVLLRGMGEG